MCDFCKNGKTLLQKDEIIDEMSFGWGNVKIDRSECTEHSLSVFIDRGHLRLADPEDCNCMDAGEKIKINFCPICGKAVNST